MGVEIERKFVLGEPAGWLEDCRREVVEQGYVALAEDVEVRVRRIGEHAVLTVKRGQGRTRAETELELSAEQFDTLWPLTEGRRVSKSRHYVPTEWGTVEVDVYAEALQGLVTAELEFESERSSERFEPPEWMGEEVTGDPRYSNASLAVHGVPRPAR